jgi:hypothetical protein
MSALNAVIDYYEFIEATAMNSDESNDYTKGILEGVEEELDWS